MNDGMRNAYNPAISGSPLGLSSLIVLLCVIDLEELWFGLVELALCFSLEFRHLLQEDAQVCMGHTTYGLRKRLARFIWRKQNHTSGMGLC